MKEDLQENEKHVYQKNIDFSQRLGEKNKNKININKQKIENTERTKRKSKKITPLCMKIWPKRHVKNLFVMFSKSHFFVKISIFFFTHKNKFKNTS